MRRTEAVCYTRAEVADKPNLTPSGNPLDQRLRRQLAELVGDAGLPAAVTAHTFRRCCATELVREGANVLHVKDLLGHENLETLKHCTRLTIVDVKKTHARGHPRERQG